MIEWKEYNPNTPPDIENTYLVAVKPPYSNETYMSVATLEVFNGKIWFCETMDGTSLQEVTHYAEINFPWESEYK